MSSKRSHNIVFFLPVLALVLGLLAVIAEVRKSENQRHELLREQFESDAALRFLVRDGLAMRLQTNLLGFIQA